MNYDVSIYGHITKDTVYDNLNKYQSVVAVGNVWDGIIHTDLSLNLNIQATSMGEALIMIDKKKLQKVTNSHLNLQTRKPKIHNSRWHHIMYLNRLDDISFINELSGVISADITDGDTSNFEYLDKVDYLFLSKKDLNISIDELVSKVKGWVIIHDVNGSHSTNGKESFDVNIDEVITNINVLGAGDYFASSFICHRLKEFEVKESIKFSHNNVSRILKIRNNVL